MGPTNCNATVAVLGAGGRTGRECVKELLRQGYNVKAIVRSPGDYPPTIFFPDDEQPATQSIEVVQGDVTDPSSLRKGLSDAKGGLIFAASGKTYFSPDAVDFKGVCNVIEVIKELKKEHNDLDSNFRFILISSCLVTPRNALHPARIALNLIRWRLMDKKYAGEVALRESGIPYTIVRPGGLKNTPRGKQRLVVSQGDNQSVSTVSRSDVAAVCVACLEMASTKNVTFEVTTASPATSPVEGVDQQLAKVLSGLKPDDQCQ